MLERLLVPLDTSENAERVLPYVKLLASGLQQPAILLVVVTDVAEDAAPNPVTSGFDAVLADLTDRRRTHAERYLADISRRLQLDGVWASAVVRTGNPVDEIVTAATIHRAGLIAMATHGRVGPERWFLGSVTDHVLRATTIPSALDPTERVSQRRARVTRRRDRTPGWIGGG